MFLSDYIPALKYGATINVDIELNDLTATGDIILGSANTDSLTINAATAMKSQLDFSDITIASANTDGGVVKGGDATSRIVADVADMKFLSFYFDNGATSGDTRGLYLRMYLTGAGNGGEAARIFTTVEDVAAGTAHGAHISLNFGDTGSVTGLGIAGRNTVHVPDAAISGGTYAAIQAEIYADGSSSDISGATNYSFIRLVAGGDATGLANVDTNVTLFDMSGLTTASGKFVDTAKTTHTAYGGIPINTDDGIKWLAVVSA